MYSTPSQDLMHAKEAEQKMKVIHDDHLANKGNNTKIWPGVKKFSDEEIRKITQITYFVRDPEKINKIRSEYPTYERIFCVRPGWDMYMPRDDRQSIKVIGQRFSKEEFDRDIPMLTSSLYGKSYIGPLETMSREYSRKMQIPEFYRLNGVNLPPLRKA